MHIFSPGLSSRGIGEDGWTDQRGRVSECICQTDKEKGMLEILERGGGYDALKTMQCVCACVHVCGGGGNIARLVKEIRLYLWSGLLFTPM